MFEQRAAFVDEPLATHYADIANSVKDAEFMNFLQLTNPSAHSLLRDTCSLTRMEGSSKINVVPAEANIELDCRLLPDQDPEKFISDLKIIINDPDVSIERIMGFTAAASSSDTSFYRLIEDTLHEFYPGSKVIPGVSTGFTDSHFFRDLGITSYGFGPFVVPPADRRGVHGNNERISVDSLHKGTEVMIDLITSFSTD